MQLNRRHFICAAAAGALTAPRAFALTEASFDDFTIRTVSDGVLVLPTSFLLPAGTEAATAEALLAEAGLSGDNYEAPLNVTLMQRGDRMVLFDAGSGPDFMASAGLLPQALDAMGVGPEQITDLIFTHAHPDHVWGVLDDFDEPLFVNARHLIGRIERDFWMDPATLETIDPARQSFVAGARRRIEALGSRLEVFEDGDSLLEGVTAMLTPGHTPGHMGFNLAESAFVAGDAVTNAHLGFRRPAEGSGSDQNPEIASETRLKLLTRLNEWNIPIIGYHLPDGGIGRVRRAGDGFEFQSGEA